MFLKVQNSGVAPIQAFTVLGVSTAREDSSKIGQFGSGAKHGINLLLRTGLNPIIFLGDDELKFFSQPEFMGEKQFNRVWYVFQGEKHKTGFSTEFGEMDWDDIGMALREVISNALDAGGVSNVAIEVVDRPVSAEGSTTVYIPLTPAVQEYYNCLSRNFLHFIGRDRETVLEKDGDKCKIYRKGVFVREIESPVPSLFNYNFGDNIKIDESRNMDNHSCLKGIASTLSNSSEHMDAFVLDQGTSEEGRLEDQISYWDFEWDAVQESWARVWGDGIPCDNEKVAAALKSKGHTPVRVRNSSLFINSRVKGPSQFLLSVESSGYVIQKANSTTTKNFNKVWRKLETIGLTNGKPKPQLFNFTGVATNGGTLRGYYEKGGIYINLDDQGSFQTILEECAHHITGAEDFTREFQEFAFNVACRLVPAWNK